MIHSVLNKYCSMWGKLLNLHTSAIQCTKNVSPQACIFFEEMLGMDNASSFGNYLGCLIIDSRLSKKYF